MISVGLALVLFFGYRCFAPQNYKNFPPAATGEWIAFGDSLTAGVGAEQGKDFPTLLGKKLDRTIHNFGVPGHTTEDGLNRVDEAIAAQPRVVLLCLGGNDGLKSLPQEQMFRNLSAIIDRFHAAGSFVILIGVHSASFRDSNADGFENLAREKEVFLIPNILDGVLGTPSLMDDYIHPNSAGYEKIAERLYTEIAPLLGKL